MAVPTGGCGGWGIIPPPEDGSLVQPDMITMSTRLNRNGIFPIVNILKSKILLMILADFGPD